MRSTPAAEKLRRSLMRSLTTAFALADWPGRDALVDSGGLARCRAPGRALYGERP
ncbi:hypothetical protein [Planomonospora sp. ID82291]|uniref:hypothetical protein n=1 Tax=Planomonospora sp. ID82291 TaxID=2738136 RepID=UPI0018C40814|nr:hypothetical protein [Planomonospora sp. ID82291]MBG0813479.1 hypothetical protein [Planomonospora sp. ID82291]